MFSYAVDDRDVGEAQLSFRWIEKIAEKVDVTLITMGSRINPVCGFESHPAVALVPVVPRVKLRWTGAFDRVFKPDYLEVFVRARRAARALLAHSAFDALHHIAPHSPRYPSPLSGLHKNFIVGPIHGGLPLPEAFRQQNLRTRLANGVRNVDTARFRYDPLMRRHFSSAKTLLISAPYVKDVIPADYADKCQVLPPQPPERATEVLERPQPSPLKLIFVGRLIDNKGIRYAIEAVAKAQVRDVVFNIFGEGELRPELQRQIDRLGLTDRVFLQGFASHREVLQQFQQHHVLLFPSLKEAWGLAVAEAMCAGLAVVCIDRGGPGYMVDGACGIKVAAQSPESLVSALADAIDQLGSDPVRVQHMGRAASAKINASFTWDALTERLVNLYGGLNNS